MSSALLSFCVFTLTGCTQPPALSSPEPEISTPTGRADNPSFQDIFAEYQAANQRLTRVTGPLLLKNAALCPNTWRDPGFEIHRLEDYPTRMQGAAEDLLNVKAGGIYVRYVRPESSAEAARIMPGDQILAVNENAIKEKPLMESYNRAIFRNGFESVLSKVRIRTSEGREYIARVRPETLCDIPIKLISSEEINGQTDGQDIFITSALMRSVPDDSNLALVIAHEMSHVIAGHMTQPPSQALEMEADRMALVLMARAGYDIESAVTYWETAAHPHGGGQISESSHPTTRERYENFKQALKRIKNHHPAEPLGF